MLTNLDTPAGGLEISKRYDNLKGAHRQWKHPGHCSYVHGENWSVEIFLQCDRLDKCGFVVDFGKLRSVKEMLDDLFDHTLLIDEDDPMLHAFEAMDADGTCRLKVVPSASAEGLASLIAGLAQDIVSLENKDRVVWVSKVIVYEDSKNKATYYAH